MATIYQNGIQYSGSGEPLVYDDMGGATSTTDGVHGLVPAPSAGDNEKFLSGDGSWKSIEEYVTKTASGNPIEISDGANAPLVKCVTQITGYQSGTGTPSPENIRPITAYTEGEIEVRGRNLFDANGFVSSYSSNYQIASDGSVETISSLLVNNVFWNNTDDYEGNLTISYKYKYINTGSVGLRLKINYADGTSETVSTTNSQTYNTITKTTTKKVSNIVTDYGSGSNTTNFYLMVVTGDRAYDYEPYITPTTHTSTYPSAIFRGSEDVVKGEVTSDSVKKVYNSSTGWVDRTSDLAGMFGLTLDITYNRTKLSDIISNLYEINLVTGFDLSQIDKLNVYAGTVNTSIIYIRPQGGTLTSLSELNTFLATNPLEVVFPLATPTTSSVTPTNLPVKSLNGYSHIESSTGEMEIEYITKNFSPITEIVDSQISALQKMMELMLTSARETEMVASANYTTGTLIVACGALYKATTAISSGASLVVGTNITPTTIAAELAALA